MTLHVSAALRDAMLDTEDFKHAMNNCVLKVYTGPQPASAELPPSGTLLCIYSDNFGSVTREVLSQGSILITNNAGTMDGITVNSIEILGTVVTALGTLTLTAAAIAKAINDNPKNLLYIATSASDLILITAKRGLGAIPNGWTVTSSMTTMTSTDANFGDGALPDGVAGVNGLKWGDVVAGIVSKVAAQIWAGNAVASGIGGWFRFEASVADPTTLDSTESIYRMDGAVANTGAELNLGNTSMTSGVPQIIGTFTVQLPTA